MGHQDVIVSTRCVLVRDGKLLAQRGKRGHLRLPGGRVGNHETLTQCLKREMFEELGMNIEVGKLLYIVESFYRNKRGKITHEISFYFECFSSDEPRPREKHIEVLWVELGDENLNMIRPRALAGILHLDWKRGWVTNPRYLVSFEDIQ